MARVQECAVPRRPNLQCTDQEAEQLRRQLAEAEEKLKAERSSNTRRTADLQDQLQRVIRQLQAVKEENNARQPDRFPISGKVCDDEDDSEYEEYDSYELWEEKLLVTNEVNSGLIKKEKESGLGSLPQKSKQTNHKTSHGNTSKELPRKTTDQIPQRHFQSSSKPPGSTKRQRSMSLSSEPEDLEDDLEFISSENVVTTKRKRACLTGFSTLSVRERFDFVPVTKHDPDGTIVAYDIADLRESMEDFWEIFTPINEEWEEWKGGHWRDVFEAAKTGRATKVCVTAKLSEERTRWRSGGAGLYACMSCVEKRWPCFTWTGEEFWLLPLHETDRKFPVRKDFEIRHWLNVE